MPSGGMMAQDMSVPPPMFFSQAPQGSMTSPTGMEEVIQGMAGLEFRRGGGGQAYPRRDNRPPQQYYQPPAQRR